jgi:hypothetical protein
MWERLNNNVFVIYDCVLCWSYYLTKLMQRTKVYYKIINVYLQVNINDVWQYTDKVGAGSAHIYTWNNNLVPILILEVSCCL